MILRTPVDLLGRYSNPDNVSRLHRILAGQGRDRPSHRPVPSVRQQQTRLTDSQRSELLDRYLAGEPATALAKEFGVHRATVFSFLRRAGVQTRYRILSDDDVAVAQTMYEAGQSLAMIGEHFGVADRTVLNVFRRLGIPTRARNQPMEPPLELEAALQDLEIRWTIGATTQGPAPLGGASSCGGSERERSGDVPVLRHQPPVVSQVATPFRGTWRGGAAGLEPTTSCLS